jgi:hypothetical protein
VKPQSPLQIDSDLIDRLATVDHDQTALRAEALHQRPSLSLINIEPLEDGILGIIAALVDLTFRTLTAGTVQWRRCKLDMKGISALPTNTATAETTNQFCRVTLEEDDMIERQFQCREQPPEGRTLLQISWISVEQPAASGVLFGEAIFHQFQDHGIRDQVSGVHELLRFESGRGSTSQCISKDGTRRDVRDLQLQG